MKQDSRQAGRMPHRRAVRRRLLNWYDKNRRDLPWRRRPHDAYAQLLAEFMLQQTQVSTVIDYYDRFRKRFPTIKALARADRDDVLALWSGLGYYSRARNLHATACRIVEEHGGIVPATVDELTRLPGIGRYTAGAIASIAYDARAPVLDGNVIRVLTRLLAMTGDPKSPAVRCRLWTEAESLLPRKRCGDFNQALMELGAMVCAPRWPDCPACPVRNCCGAHRDNLTGQIPPVAKRTRVLPATVVVIAARRGDRLLFVQRPSTGLWAGLWELPSEPVGEKDTVETGLNRLQKRLHAKCQSNDALVGRVTRQLTHRKVTFHVYRGMVRTNRLAATVIGQPCRWLHGTDLPTLGISRACEAILELLDWPE